MIADLRHNRRDALMRSYKELTKRIPLVKTLAEQGDVDVLEALYKNVCACIPTSTLLRFNADLKHSCALGRMPPGVTMLAISRPLSLRGSTICMGHLIRCSKPNQRMREALRTITLVDYFVLVNIIGMMQGEVTNPHISFYIRRLTCLDKCTQQYPRWPHRLLGNCSVMARILLCQFRLRYKRHREGALEEYPVDQSTIVIF